MNLQIVFTNSAQQESVRPINLAGKTEVLRLNLRYDKNLEVKHIRLIDDKECETQSLLRNAESTEYKPFTSYERSVSEEAQDQYDLILKLIRREALSGRLYTMRRFCYTFANRHGLSGKSSICEKINILATDGHIKFMRNGSRCSTLRNLNFKCHGFLWVENMLLKSSTGEVVAVYPSHFKCNKTGEVLPLKNQKVWEGASA